LILRRRFRTWCDLVSDGTRTLSRTLLDLVYPEVCLLCGAERGECPWSAVGAIVTGLAWYDGPHLCRSCARHLRPAVVRGTLPETGVPVYGGQRTGPELVTLLGRWKYHGVRGLAWPLAALVQAAASEAVVSAGAVAQLVPVALHTRRQRARGFNQAAVLARLVANAEAIRHRPELLTRIRFTGQQAKLATETARRGNLAGAFRAVSCAGTGDARRVGLVDDLVTGGATCDEAVRALTAGGWQVSWVISLGLAAGLGDESLAAVNPPNSGGTQPAMPIPPTPS